MLCLIEKDLLIEEVQFRKFRIGHTDPSDHGNDANSIEPREEPRGDEDDSKRSIIPFRSHSEPSNVQSIYKNKQDSRQPSTASEDTLIAADTETSFLLSRQTTRNKDYNDPLGLSLVHSTPESEADIIFVHGLGGSSWRTWSWERQPEIFWPEWLQHEDGLSHFRVFTYGYNANFMDTENPLSILDFSKGLLIRMKTYGNEEVDYIGMVSTQPSLSDPKNIKFYTNCIY